MKSEFWEMESKYVVDVPGKWFRSYHLWMKRGNWIIFELDVFGNLLDVFNS